MLCISGDPHWNINHHYYRACSYAVNMCSDSTIKYWHVYTHNYYSVYTYWGTWMRGQVYLSRLVTIIVYRHMTPFHLWPTLWSITTILYLTCTICLQTSSHLLHHIQYAVHDAVHDAASSTIVCIKILLLSAFFCAQSSSCSFIALFLLATADYVCGGEMFTHLHQVGPFSERHARVYVAEITLALEHLHKVSMSSLSHSHSL